MKTFSRQDLIPAIEEYIAIANTLGHVLINDKSKL
jgi:hypothetical protein